MKKVVTIFLLVFLFAFSCVKKKAENNKDILGLEYYPTTPGKFIIYQVDSTVYRDLAEDTLVFKFRIKEKIADSFVDNLGQNAIRIERYVKNFNPNKSYDSIPWSVRDVYFLSASNKNIQIVENNFRYTKLIFPVQARVTWNGNAANNLGEQMYQYDYIDNTDKINGNNFDNVLMVIQKEFHPLILDYFYAEKYAKGVGLIYKEITDVYSQGDPTVPVLQRIQYGLVYKQSFISIGYE